MTKTEKLRKEVFKALENHAYETDQIEAILKACKEQLLFRDGTEIELDLQA